MDKEKIASTTNDKEDETKQFIKDIVFNGYGTKTVHRFDRDWEFRTLNRYEHMQVYSFAFAGTDNRVNWEKFKQVVLRTALVSVNRIPTDDEINERLFSSLQKPVIDALFEEYQKIDALQLEAIDNIENIKNLKDDFFSYVKYKVMRAANALPTEQRCKDMNDHQWLWYYYNLMEDQEEEEKTCKYHMDYLSFFINPELAAKMRDIEDNKTGSVNATNAHDEIDPSNPNVITHYGDTTVDEDFEKKIEQFMQGPVTHLDDAKNKGNMYESKESFIARAIQGANKAEADTDFVSIK